MVCFVLFGFSLQIALSDCSLKLLYQTAVWRYCYFSEWIWFEYAILWERFCFPFSFTLSAQFISDSYTSLTWETARMHWYCSRL